MLENKLIFIETKDNLETVLALENYKQARHARRHTHLSQQRKLAVNRKGSFMTCTFAHLEILPATPLLQLQLATFLMEEESRPDK